MATMATAARKRTAVPKTATKAEVPATPAPDKAHYTFVYKGKIHHGFKARAMRLVARTKAHTVKTAKRVVTFVKTAARKVATVAKAGAKRVLPIAKRAWTVALRPFLNGIGAGLALGTLIVSTVVSPFVTVLVLLGTGGALLLFARGIKSLENNEFTSPIARALLFVFDMIGLALKVAFYISTAFIALALSFTSPAFALFSGLLLVLGYFDVRGAGTIAFLVWCVFSGSWGLGLAWLLWRALRGKPRHVPEYSEMRIKHEEYADVRHAPAIEVTDIDATGDEKVTMVDSIDHVAVGTEEVTHLYAEADAALAEMHASSPMNAACASCGTTKGSLRVKSQDIRFLLTGEPVSFQTERGVRTHGPDDMLCGDCYDAECEDNALAMTGVSLKKRSVNVVLNAVGRSTLPEYAASKTDVANVYWATTAWWRDRRGHHHERQWDCFHDGKVVASVLYDHSRKVYRASALEKFIGTKTALGVAKKLATDTLFDDANAVDRMVEALGNTPNKIGDRDDEAVVLGENGGGPVFDTTLVLRPA